MEKENAFLCLYSVIYTDKNVCSLLISYETLGAHLHIVRVDAVSTFGIAHLVLLTPLEFAIFVLQPKIDACL